ncbi:homoserine dehydrogenase [Coralloluteibacterium stylophorae]|uniref:homoserine dehydrogenase n=1 Tax=Coralloluteibacterium stylophorae TaxID=1776034 RepID=A0AAP2CA12_9GAMM|nr:homoserine dehydrogenase [Coralloluteibacterium stylophorae]MBS7456381.1 homoserine dehydrogenase [Coralloluteibacterium stylophorae]
MSALATAATTPVPAPRLALLGTGLVGSAFVARHARLGGAAAGLPGFRWLANSRTCAGCGEDAGTALDAARAAPQGAAGHVLAAIERGDIVVDATASDAVAARHAEWLARGIHVVTANKLGHGAGIDRSRAICDAQARHRSRYGDGATVGAGLPLLASLRTLVAGGDRVHAIEGVLSGSLAWLFNGYDGREPFSARLRAAREAGYTEPDPRIDLSGEDVRRKLLILARAAGWPIAAEAVAVRSLVPAALASVQGEVADEAWRALDVPLADRLAEARRDGGVLRMVGRVDAAGATVGLRVLAPTHPLAGGEGTDNRVAIWSDRYPAQPLVIQGPGAGAEVTAAALLDDVLRIAAG